MPLLDSGCVPDPTPTEIRQAADAALIKAVKVKSYTARDVSIQRQSPSELMEVRRELKAEEAEAAAGGGMYEPIEFGSVDGQEGGI